MDKVSDEILLNELGRLNNATLIDPLEARLEAKKRWQRLILAATALYNAGYWELDRTVEGGEEKLWEELRDALGLAPGSSPVKLDEMSGATYDSFSLDEKPTVMETNELLALMETYVSNMADGFDMKKKYMCIDEGMWHTLQCLVHAEIEQRVEARLKEKDKKD